MTIKSRSRKHLWLIFTLGMLACLAVSTPAIPATESNPNSPDTQPPEPESLPAPAVTMTLLPTRDSVPANEPIPTNTELPPIPDFASVIEFAGGGGDAPCLYVPSQPLPAVEGGTAFSGYGSYLPRSGILCIWGAPFDTELQVSLTSPSGRATLRADILVQSSDASVIWLGQNFQKYASLAQPFTETTAIYLDIWWPGNQESGDWSVQVRWAGGEVNGIFGANTRQRPEISVKDNRADSMLLSGKCLQMGNENQIEVLGEAFIPEEWAFILVYQNVPGEQIDTLHEVIPVKTDQEGIFTIRLNGSYAPGWSYSLIGVQDPNAEIVFSDNLLNYDAIADAVDCFHIVDQLSSAPQPPSVCPGAPVQRIKVNMQGYVCTQGDSVRLRISPARSASTIIQLLPGTRFMVVDGPVCADDWSWWYIRLNDGTTGWISEGGDDVDPYFICPVP